jgi:hypothetical protein
MTVKGIDHLVLCGSNLEKMREKYSAVGFTLTPPAQHPFGTHNSLVQLDHVFLELLGIGQADNIPEHEPQRFSFAAFNRDFLESGEGFSMLVLDSEDARKDIADFQDRGLHTFEPFDFTRRAKLPGGEEVVVGFSLAFATSPQMPNCGFFCCQQHAPQYFWQKAYQTHRNGALTVLDVALVADHPESLRDFLEKFSGLRAEQAATGFKIATKRGDISVITPDAFANAYNSPPPDMSGGARFGGYTVGVGNSSALRGTSIALFGTTVRFEEVPVAAGEERL